MVNSSKVEANEQIELKLKKILDAFLKALPEDVQNILNKTNININNNNNN